MKKLLAALLATVVLVVGAITFDKPLMIWADSVALNLARFTPGPIATFLSTWPAFIEFSRSGWPGGAKGSIGALGSPEMNMSFNMDYATGEHRHYNPGMDSYWMALNEAGLYLQYAPKMYGPGDVWDRAGNPVAASITMDNAWFNGKLSAPRSSKAVWIANAAGLPAITIPDSNCRERDYVSAEIASNDPTALKRNVLAGVGGFTVNMAIPATGGILISYLCVGR